MQKCTTSFFIYSQRLQSTACGQAANAKNTQFRYKTKKKAQKTAVLYAFPGLSDKTWTCGLYHPNRLLYIFLAVFAFFSPFCYAKTAFSYSRALFSPCTPVLFMVKDVVKSEYRMIDMWSSFWGGRSAWNFLRRQRRNISRSEKKHANCHMWSSSRKEMITMWSDKIKQQEQRTALSFFCRCCIVTYNRSFVK